ncbi:T3SS (YopN, CesT) and YbjN peptide-binding chaperone 1 [Janibacter indicus]|uniref:T3SS (YopN, CesT) and YbjN peptide-binding chaperone 1 n=1 Tax=Janibacter indicus TaxID=857417 RepID=UPI003D9A94C8
MSDPTALPNFGTSPTPAGDQPEQEAPLRDRIEEALRELGLEPRIDDEGDVAFTFSEQQMFVRAADDESNVLRVFGQWALEDPVPTDPMERLQVSNDLNVAFNLVKAAVAGDTLLVTSEHILPRGADVRGLLGLALPLVLQGVQLWHQRATGQELEDAVEGDQAGQEPQA